MESTKTNTLAVYTDEWNDEIKVVEIGGAVFTIEGDETRPVLMDCHQGGIEKFPMNRENVKEVGWEIGEDPGRCFCSVICLPSECFKSDLESEFDETTVKAIMDFYAEELKAADEAAREELKPNEEQGIKDDVEMWLDEEGDELEEMSDEEKASAYLEAVNEWRRDYIAAFHDDDEIREIVKKQLKK